MKANSPPPELVEGKKVGALLHRAYDAYWVSKKGGVIVYNDERDVNSFEDDVAGLIEKLRREEIDGFVLDVYTMYVVTILAPLYLSPQNIDFFDLHTLRTEKTFDAGLSYGMLVRDKEDYDYFKDYAFDTQLRLEMMYSSEWVTQKMGQRGRYYSAQGENRLFSTDAHYFQQTVIVILVVVTLLFTFGWLYERKRKKLHVLPCVKSNRVSPV